MDPYATNPGPLDGSVLCDQEKHVSSAVWDGQVELLSHSPRHPCFFSFFFL